MPWHSVSSGFFIEEFETLFKTLNFERSCYVVPDSGAEKVYTLLLEAMRKEECLGIARIGMHRREHMRCFTRTKYAPRRIWS